MRGEGVAGGSESRGVWERVGVGRGGVCVRKWGNKTVRG